MRKLGFKDSFEEVDRMIAQAGRGSIGLVFVKAKVPDVSNHGA